MLKGVRIGAVSLGCSKNRVDTEYMLGILMSAGAVIVADEKQADAIVINTCGFIEDAKAESINTILEMAQLKKTGRLRALIVTGCLSQRYRDELSCELPEVDAFLGVHNCGDIATAVNTALAKQRYISYDACERLSESCRVLTTPPYQAYVKIAEGCSNRCAYCAIPSIRGPLQSRTIESVADECRRLVEGGVKELILVAQDTTKYGVDIYGRKSLPRLLNFLSEIDGFTWLRVLYCYPENVTKELLDAMTADPRICKYIDMPIQHISDGVLQAMNRQGKKRDIYKAVETIRHADPDFVLRTTLLTGFPGETEEQHRELLAAVNELSFDRAGVFRYSQEDGTPAAELPGQIPEDVKQRRYDELMTAAAEMSEAKNQKRIGREYKVLIEGHSDELGYLGRSYAEAPEIDGQVFVSGSGLREGEYVNVRVTDAYDYDVAGVTVE